MVSKLPPASPPQTPEIQHPTPSILHLQNTSSVAHTRISHFATCRLISPKPPTRACSSKATTSKSLRPAISLFFVMSIRLQHRPSLLENSRTPPIFLPTSISSRSASLSFVSTLQTKTITVYLTSSPSAMIPKTAPSSETSMPAEPLPRPS